MASIFADWVHDLPPKQQENLIRAVYILPEVIVPSPENWPLRSNYSYSYRKVLESMRQHLSPDTVARETLGYTVSELSEALARQPMIHVRLFVLVASFLAGHHPRPSIRTYWSAVVECLELIPLEKGEFVFTEYDEDAVSAQEKSIQKGARRSDHRFKL